MKTKKSKTKRTTKTVSISAKALKEATDRLVKANGWNTPLEYLKDLQKELGLS